MGDAQPWRLQAGTQVGHDLSGLQAAVACRAARAPLENLQQRKVDVLVQTLKAADGLVTDGQPLLDTRHVDADIEALKVGLLRAPWVVGHRAHYRGKHLFVIGDPGHIQRGLCGGLRRCPHPPRG
ncbi:hypothetical protein D3C71_1859880 [compost metagenome]